MMKIALLAADYELRSYAQSLSRLNGMDWVGYCLTSDSGALQCEEDWATEHLPRVYQTPQQLASDADLVVVGGKPEQRFDYISSLLRQGKSVWSDWPLSTTGAKVRKLAALAEEARVCTQVAHAGRKHPVWLSALPYLHDVRMIRSELSVPSSPGLEHSLDYDLFPYIDRVLALEQAEVKSVRARKVGAQGGEGFSAQMEIEFFSGLLAEFWLSNVMPVEKGKMRCINAEAIVDLDFVGFELAWQDARKISNSRKITVNRSPGSGEETFLTHDLQFFTHACRSGKQGSLNFSESGQVQEVLFQIKRILL
ncbi:MAG: Gfo/Idh/MocA family oxidoreductase [Bacteroides sp.]|nr:Gfo/Idh/MocA family oxidoreductase [Bacteroides sp.]